MGFKGVYISQTCFREETSLFLQMKFLVWYILASLSYKSASSLLTIVCIVRCAHPPTPHSRDFCAECVETTNIGNAEACLYSCENSLYSWLYHNVCDRCVKHASLSSRLCVHACKSTDSPEFETICDRCVNQIFPDHGFCSHACQQDATPEFQDVCDRCANFPWDSRFYE